MNNSDIKNLREQVAAIVERIDSLEAQSNDTITPEVFEQKLLNVFKAGLMQGRKEQYDETYQAFDYNTGHIDIYAGDLNIIGDISFDDIGVTSICEDTCMSENEWADVVVEMTDVDAALKKFKPEEPTTEESNTETPES